jgi:hypothetical protein
MRTDQEAIVQAEEWYAASYRASAHGHVLVNEHGNPARTESWLWIDLVPEREEAEVITVAIAVRGETAPLLVGEGRRCPRCPLGEQTPWRPNAEVQDDDQYGWRAEQTAVCSRCGDHISAANGYTSSFTGALMCTECLHAEEAQAQL